MAAGARHFPSLRKTASQPSGGGSPPREMYLSAITFGFVILKTAKLGFTQWVLFLHPLDSCALLSFRQRSEQIVARIAQKSRSRYAGFAPEKRISTLLHREIV